MKPELSRLQRIARGRDPWVFAGVVLISAVMALVNITSINMEARMNGHPSPGITPWINEPTAVVAILLLYPLLRQMATWLPLPPESWRRFFALHALAALVYALAQFALMTALRMAAWPVIAHRGYYYSGHAAYEFLYELRKQAVVYLVILASIYVVRALAEQALELRQLRDEAKRSGKISLKCGARQIRLEAQAFTHAEAAGNYAEVHAGDATHLARSTLHALQEQLQAAGVRALRVHRAVLVNMDQVREAAPAGNGDWSLTLANGATLRASRRYRDEFRALIDAA